MPRFGAAPLALAFAVGAAACGGTGAVEADDAPGDASADAAAAPDADGGAPVDAGPDVVDAGEDAADAGKRYCQTLVPAPRFCDDFDDGNVSDDWNVLTVAPPTELAEGDTSTQTSKPASFHVKTDALGAGEQANVHLRRTLLAPVAHVKLSFSLRVPVANVASGSVAIASLDVSTNHFFTLNLRDDDPSTPGPSLEETTTGGTTRKPLTKLPPAGAWTRVVVDLDLTGGKATVSFDGDKALDAAAITSGPGSEATIRVGAVYVVGPTAAFEANVDDVVLEY